MEQLKNIFSSPKSTLRGLAIIGAIVAAVAQSYPTAKWTGVVVASIASIKEILASD